MLYYQIVTPEQVTFRYEVAGLVTRGLAWMIDLVVQIALLFLVYHACVLIGLMILSPEVWILLSTFVVIYSYHVLFEMYWRGKSVGKRIMGLRVISASGAALSFADSMLRNLLRPIDLLFYIIPIGAVVAWIDRYHRRLGDLAAGTLVIREIQRETPQALTRQNARDNSFAEDLQLRSRVLARVSREERDFIYDLIQRRDQLESAVRDDLFAQAADYFRKRFALPDDLEHLSDEQTVINLALVIQGTGGRNGR